MATTKRAGTRAVGRLALLSRGAIGLAGLALVAVAFATTYARPPKPEELVGVWIGFDSDELEFTRLDLRADFTGYCARVAPADTTLHEYGVAAYRLPRWSLKGWDLALRLAPLTAKSEPIYLRGRTNGVSLQLEVGGTSGKWKRDIVLYREARIDAANRETRDKIRELEQR